MAVKPEPESQSFLFRIWREDPSDQDTPLNFRGHMTCLPDGTRVYFQSWIEVQAFIHSCLEGSDGAELPAAAFNWTGEASAG